MPLGWHPTSDCAASCPSRAPGLTHMVASGQGPYGKRDLFRCSHCYRSYRHPPGCSHWPRDYDVTMRKREDHQFIFTMTGLCSRCSRAEGDHLRYYAEPVAACLVVHESVPTEHVSADGWTRCPSCNRMIEPVLVESELLGSSFGPGRGDATPQQKRHWDGMRKAFVAGYYDE